MTFEEFKTILIRVSDEWSFKKTSMAFTAKLSEPKLLVRFVFDEDSGEDEFWRAEYQSWAQSYGEEHQAQLLEALDFIVNNKEP